MGKVHALIIQRLAEAEKAERPASQEATQTTAEVLARPSDELGNGSDNAQENLTEFKPADVSADLVMGHFTAEGPLIPDAPNPAPDDAGETVNAVVPSQLDNLSSASDGPVTRLEFQTLAAQVAIVEAWIKRRGSKI